MMQEKHIQANFKIFSYRRATYINGCAIHFRYFIQYDSLLSCTLSRDLLHNIWNKASKLVNASITVMAPAPGPPPEARTVQSTSQTGFYLITPDSNGKFSCDCAYYHSLSLCSHVVAVAEINYKLVTFLK